MHPTDTLLSLSHARIARAAAAGPRRATQPTALTDRQRVAFEAQEAFFQQLEADAAQMPIPQWAPEILRLNTLARADGVLAQRIDQL